MKYNDWLTEEVIKTSIINNYGCKIPTIENELMLRKMEYDTYIKSRPDKIKQPQQKQEQKKLSPREELERRRMLKGL